MRAASNVAPSSELPVAVCISASVSAPERASTAPLGLRMTSASASIWFRYSSASGCTVGASLVATAPISFGRSAMSRVMVVKVSVKAARR